MTYDVVIIGGSFAGLAAAMQLVRAHGQVMVIDTRQPRNRFARTSHGVFGLDGNTPAEIREISTTQLQAYPTFTLQEDEAIGVTGEDLAFSITCQSGLTVNTRKIILATGLTDTLPDIPGLQARWGKTVVHCPYCHGYELKASKLGVLMLHPLALHQAALVADWAPVTLFTQGYTAFDDEQRALINKRNIRMVTTNVVSIEGEDMAIERVGLEDGSYEQVDGLFVGATIAPTGTLCDQLNLKRQTLPNGDIIEVDQFKQTSVAGIYAAGDLSNPMQNGTFAIASGVMAGVGAHHSLIFG